MAGKQGPPKGVSNNPNGRPKGVPNKVTTRIKEAMAALLESNLDKTQSWLDQVAQDSPKDALAVIFDVSERFLPKLARTELANAEGETFKTEDVTKKILAQLPTEALEAAIAKSEDNG